MRLTADILAEAPCLVNPLKDRELDLRGLKVPDIENMGATRDLNDAIDLADNDLKQLGNFPTLRRLKHLYLSNNRISVIDPSLTTQLPNLTTLILSNNSIQDLISLEPLVGATKLYSFSLIDNPVIKTGNYRLWCIHRFPSVRFLDFQRVTDKERKEAKIKFLTPEGNPTLVAAAILGQQPDSTFQANLSISEIEDDKPTTTLTEEEQRQIESSLANASELV